MKKFLLSIFAVLFAFAGVQAEEVVYTLEPANGSNNSYAGNCDITIDGIIWNLEGNSTTIPWRIGGKNLTNVDRALYSKTEMESAVSKVVLTTGTYNLSAVNSAKLLVANNADFTGAVEYSFTFVASSDIEIPISAAAGSYYKFVFNVSAGSDNKYLQFIRAKFYGTAAGGGETPEPEPEEPKVGYTLVTSINDLSAGDNVVIVATNANVALSTTQNSNNRGKASVTKSDNIVTFGDDVQVMTLEAGSVSGTFAFNTGNGYLYAASSGSNYLRTEATLSANSSWNITIANTGVATIKAQGSNARNWLRYNSSSSIFSCYGSGQADVSIYKLYEEGETPAETVDAPILPESTTFEGSMFVEITGIAADATVYYTTDESDPTTSDTRVEYTEPFEIIATTTVKAVAVNEVDASEVVTKIYTLFVVEETEGYYIKVVSAPADWSGKYLIVYEDGADAYVFNGEDIVNGYVSATTDGDVIKANSKVDAVAVTVAAMDGGYSVKTADGYIYGVENSNALKFNDTDQANTIAFVVGEGVEIISNTSVLRFNSASNQMRFRYYKSGQQPVQLYKYVEELPLYHTLTVTEAGWATLYLGFNARIPSAVEAYTVTAVNSGWVSLTQVTGVLPSSQGVIIKAPKGEYKLFNEATATADVTGNLLEGTLFDTYIDEEAYVLGNVDGVGLYKAEMNKNEAGETGTTHFKNNANKAYLPASVLTPAQQTVAFYGFDWDGTTGIDQITDNREQSTAIYDLTGRRIDAITAPGIYVVNGKKVLVK